VLGKAVEASMDVFQWSDIYLIGIPEIDEQHQQLVQLVNRLGEWATFGAANSEFDAIVAEIFDYAATHFANEDHIWASMGIDVQHQQSHAGMHGNFVRQMRHMQQQFDKPQRDAPIVHSFLTAWLVYHILGEDKRMARLAGVLGDKPDELAETGSTRILHSAVQTLYRELSQKNEELVALNNGLEQKVAQRTAELDVARVRLMENERMASVGQLAAGVAHEINNPLGFVSSNLYSLGEYVHDLLYLLDACIAVEPTLGRGAQAIQHIHSLCEELDLPFIREDITKLLNESREGLDRVKDIVQDLRIFSRVDGDNWQMADLSEGLMSTLNLAGKQLRQRAELRLDIQPLPPVRCNAAQLNQVLMNLLVNAGQAVQAQGWIAVRTGSDEQTVWVEVEDNGCGISPANQRRIFEPFFTTKPVGVGTGLGLALSWGIIEQHHGHITVRSAEGQGSCFRITLPRTQEGLRDG
jgi:two-component system NtrC family sensor kinase